MAFISRSLTEEEYEKYNMASSLGSRTCVADDGRDAILISKGGGGRDESPNYSYEFRWKGELITFKSPTFSTRNQEGKKVIIWEILHLNIPLELKLLEKEVKELLKEAIIVYGDGMLSHLPQFKYDILRISKLEEEPYIYIAGE